MRPAPESGPIARAEDLLTEFPVALRGAGLPIDPGRVATFLKAVTVCRLESARDLARIGRVTLVGSPDDFAAYDDVFEALFGAATVAGKVASPTEEAAPRTAPPHGDPLALPLTDGVATGRSASDDHLRNRKAFGALGEAARRDLAAIARRLEALPSLRRRRHVASERGDRIDLARTARAARKTFGETLRLMRTTRPRKPRRVLILIDVSGSMKAHSELALRFAQRATRQLDKVETFCFGTRLSRVTATLRHPHPEEALRQLAELVFDFDGGTLIGASLEEFLSVSRHAALVRGAVTIVFSDGLERGDPATMVHAVDRLARLSHRLVWATPLAADPRYRPATRAMAAVLPRLDALADGSSLAALDRLVAELAVVGRMGRFQAGGRFRKGGREQ